MSIKAHVYAENLFYLGGEPLKMPYDTMRHLYPIYDLPSKDIMLKFGRQAHKSTTLGNLITLPCIKYDTYRTVYVAPTGNQVSVFSSDKLANTVHDSPIVRENYLNTHTKDHVFYKEFSNLSKIYLRSAYHTADSIRGISADMMCLDEVQDIVSDHISVIAQCMSGSPLHYKMLKGRYPNLPKHMFKRSMYAGTPKTVDNTMEIYWDQSTQTEWVIKCQHMGCKKYNVINEYNAGDKFLICNKCGKAIHYRDGQWIDMCPNNFIKGYRMPQLVLDWINDYEMPETWQSCVTNFRKTESTEKFYNEVLALPYASAKHPLSSAEMKAACDSEEPMIDQNHIRGHKWVKRGNKTYAGIDWGKGDTTRGTSYSILTVGTFMNQIYRVLFMKKYVGKMSDPLLQVQDMIRIIKTFDCDLTIADTGDGRTSNAMMVKALGPEKFAELMEHGGQKKKIKWDGVSGHYTINRTRVMDDIFMEIKRSEVAFFRHEDFALFQPDFTSIFGEYSEITRMTKYDHVLPDDAFHSYMFSNIAMKIRKGKYDRYLVGGAD